MVCKNTLVFVNLAVVDYVDLLVWRDNTDSVY